MKHMDILKKCTKVHTEFAKLYKQGVIGMHPDDIQLTEELFREIFTDESKITKETFVIDGREDTILNTEFGGKTFSCYIRTYD